MNGRIDRIARVSGLFFPPREVRYVFEVGGGVGQERRGGGDDLFPLAEIHRIGAAEAGDLRSYMDSRGIGGIDILDISDPALSESAIAGLGPKLRTVRFAHVRLPCDGGAFRQWFRHFMDVHEADGIYAIFVNRDVAPRMIGILKKRMGMRFGTRL